MQAPWALTMLPRSSNHGTPLTTAVPGIWPRQAVLAQKQQRMKNEKKGLIRFKLDERLKHKVCGISFTQLPDGFFQVFYLLVPRHKVAVAVDEEEGGKAAHEVRA